MKTGTKDEETFPIHQFCGGSVRKLINKVPMYNKKFNWCTKCCYKVKEEKIEYLTEHEWEVRYCPYTQD